MIPGAEKLTTKSVPNYDVSSDVISRLIHDDRNAELGWSESETKRQIALFKEEYLREYSTPDGIGTNHNVLCSGIG